MEDFSNRQFGQCSASFLGNMTVPERKVTVYTNAVVEFRQRNMLMYYTYGENGGNRVTTPFVLQGGTVRFAGDNTANGFGPIVVDGGTFEYAPNRVNAWGVFNFRGTFRVTGSKAVTLPPCAYPQLPLYPSMACVFDVEDVTGDDRYDLDSWLVPCRPPEPSFYNGSHTNASGVAEVFTFGFIKRGAGTLALNRALRGTHEFDGTAQVEAGTLVVNDDFTRNHATFSVASGAFLGGTGTVYNAEIAAGGGFRQKAGNATPLKISGDLSIGANPVFRIDNPENLDAKSVKAVVFSATGTVTGTENLANATFYLDGELQKPGTWIALYSAGRCTVKAQSGTMLILR
jgi:autotransporter-associated beta strand protein